MRKVRSRPPSNASRVRGLMSCRRFAVGAILTAAATLPAPAASAEPAIRLAPGQSQTYSLTENPSTGYSWVIDAAASRGLDIVAVADDGFRSGGTAPGAPGAHVWILRGRAPGHAEIVFVERRPWEPTPVNTQRLAIDVAAP